MGKKPYLALVRGDRRHELSCELIRKDGFEIRLIDPPDVWEALYPLPAGTIIATSTASESGCAAAKARQMKIIEYGMREDFILANAKITAENAIQIAMQQSERTISGSKALVIGYGRIGTQLASLLRGMGTYTAVCTRREQNIKIAKTDGFSAFMPCELLNNAFNFDFIFNTAPAPVLTRPVIEQMNDDVLVVDLASNLGGTDFNATQELGKKAIHALALPGKLTPLSAAVAVRDAIYAALKEAK